LHIEPEIFAATDLHALRDELRSSGLDSWQAGELIGAFLAQRGYGVSPAEARSAATRMESLHCTLDSMRQELTQLAMVM